MSGNPVQSRLAEGQAVFGGWCSSGSPFAAEVIARLREEYAFLRDGEERAPMVS